MSSPRSTERGVSILYFDVFLSEWQKQLAEESGTALTDFTLLLVDIGGDRNGEQVLRAVEACKNALPALQAVVIKSKQIGRQMQKIRDTQVIMRPPPRIPRLQSPLVPEHLYTPPNKTKSSSTPQLTAPETSEKPVLRGAAFDPGYYQHTNSLLQAKKKKKRNRKMEMELESKLESKQASIQDTTQEEMC